MRALITGVDGFAGSHLADYLLAETDYEVWGCGLTPTSPGYLDDRVQYHCLDLREPEPIVALLQSSEPQRIYHLAGQAVVSTSWDTPWKTFETNVRTTLNVLEAVRKQTANPRVLLVSSIEVYGWVTVADLPLTEEHPFQPDSPYSVSKVAQDLLGLTYASGLDLFVVRARPFNHIGPRQGEQFVATAFARQLVQIEAGLNEPVLRVGNLEARRDFTDVRDMVRAYYLLLEKGASGAAYNIGSGQLRSIQAVLDQLIALAGVQVTVEIDPDRYRPNDRPAETADFSKLRAETEWEPVIPFEQTLRDLLTYERENAGILQKETG